MAENGSPLLELTDATFEREVLQSREPVLVDFWAPWCGPCRVLGPRVEELAREYAGKVRVAKLNVDENPQTAQRFRVMSIPTLIFFKGGEAKETLIGVQPKERLKGALDGLIA